MMMMMMMMMMMIFKHFQYGHRGKSSILQNPERKSRGCLWLSRSSHLHLQSAWRTRGRSKNASNTSIEPFLNIELRKKSLLWSFLYIDDLPTLGRVGQKHTWSQWIMLDHHQSLTVLQVCLRVLRGAQPPKNIQVQPARWDVVPAVYRCNTSIIAIYNHNNHSLQGISSIASSQSTSIYYIIPRGVSKLDSWSTKITKWNTVLCWHLLTQRVEFVNENYHSHQFPSLPSSPWGANTALKVVGKIRLLIFLP